MVCFLRMSARMILSFIANYRNQTSWKVIAPVADTENSRVNVIWGVTGRYKRVFTVHCLSRASCGVVIIVRVYQNRDNATFTTHDWQSLHNALGKPRCASIAHVAFICDYCALRYKVSNKVYTAVGYSIFKQVILITISQEMRYNLNSKFPLRI